MRRPLIRRIAAAQRHAPEVVQVVGEVRKHRPGLRVDVAQRIGIEARQADQFAERAEYDVEIVERIGIQEVVTHHAVQAVAREEQLQFGRELFVRVIDRYFHVIGRQAVEVDRRPGVVLTIGDDCLERIAVVDLPFRKERQAGRLDVLIRHTQATARVEHVVEDRITRDAADQEPVPELGAGGILGEVTGEAQEQVVGHVPLRCGPKTENILVVLLGAKRQIIAITVTRELHDRATEAEVVRECT